MIFRSALFLRVPEHLWMAILLQLVLSPKLETLEMSEGGMSTVGRLVVLDVLDSDILVEKWQTVQTKLRSELVHHL